MRKALPGICVLVGAALMLIALVFFSVSYISSANTGKNAEIAVEKVLEMLPPTVKRFPEERGNNKMASMNVDGLNVVAILDFPSYGRQLGVLSTWDSNSAEHVPCRYQGSIYDRSIVIGASGRDGQLDFAAKTLDVGVRLTLTDMEGGVYTYEVAAIRHTDSADPEKLASKEHDLTIFVKHPTSGEYVLIRCKAV